MLDAAYGVLAANPGETVAVDLQNASVTLSWPSRAGFTYQPYWSDRRGSRTLGRARTVFSRGHEATIVTITGD